jgi:aminoglycoside 6-adenylyltransferase
VVEWAAGEDSVRAVLLTGSRANAHAALDAFSDFDILLFLTSGSDLRERDDWLRGFGPVLVMLRERIYHGDREIPTRLVQYRDGSRIDFTLAPLEMLHHLAEGAELPPELDSGYRILIDRDHLADRLAPPSGVGYTPARPTEEEYIAVVEEFWWESIYVAKFLARGELLPAKYSGECVLRFACLVRMLEWYVQIGGNWDRSIGPHGRGLAAHLTPRDRVALEATFAGAGKAENREALFAAIHLFRCAAAAVADELGYAYPAKVDRDVEAFLRRIQSPPGSG